VSLANLSTRKILPIRQYLTIFIVMLAIGVSQQLYATHIRAGEITIKRTNCNSLTFEITFTGYRDTSSPIIFGEGFMDFGDGSDPLLIDSNSFTATDVGNGIEKNVVTITHTFSANGLYIIGYRELNRNAGTLNIDNSVDTPFYTESQIVIDPFVGCNQSPELLIPPVDEGCTQSAFYHNAGAFDPDGDSLSYEFTIPKQDRGVDVINYRDPNTNEPRLYPNGYALANEDGTDVPTFDIDAITGDVVWDAPGAEGQYNIAFRIIEWRNIGGTMEPIGFVTRDMQILIEDCDNERPELDIPEDLCVEAGTLIDETIIGTDPDDDAVKIEVFSQLFTGASNEPIFTPNPGVNDFRPVPAQSQFTWQTSCSNVREQAYQVIFKITDNPESGPNLVTFATWNITVVGAKPELLSATRDGRAADLTFTPYDCAIAGDPVKVQIWRRVASFDYTPDECETGLPENSGYQLIDTVGTSASSYRDTNNGVGLAYGAQYCYRLIAVFPEPQGGESIVSDEFCIDPIEVSAPTITHVTVVTTDENAGSIRVSWRSPFELDLTTFDLPLSYQINRAEGLTGGTFEIVDNTSDTTILDTGLNTTDQPYQYKVTVFDNSGTEIETSVAASSVRLEPTPQFESIELNWSAEVPWSNAIQGQLHELFRDNVDSDPAMFVKIADIEVTEDGLRYLDTGEFNNTPLENTQLYCYYVAAKGSYGNPLIDTPQVNASQIACSQPSDDIPPCAIALTIDTINCRPIGDLAEAADGQYPFDVLNCGFSNFFNTLTWNEPGLCGEDIVRYDIYYKRELDDEYVKIASAEGTEFIHDNLPSYAGCYVVKSVDRSGNESEFSNEVCKDNCPNYVLPNVFTPNNDEMNDTFRAYGNVFSGSGSNVTDLKTCPRFVKSVVFNVYNRWGAEVFTYDSQAIRINEETQIIEEAILINWNGKDNSGGDLSTGVYFYSAEVTFDALNPGNKSRIIKGWVHLLK